MGRKPDTSAKRSNQKNVEPGLRLQSTLFWLCGVILALVSLSFSTSVYRTFTLPKFVVLTTGSAGVLLTLSLIAATKNSQHLLGTLRSKLTLLICAYVLAIAISTLWGLVPLASFFGSFENEMGLIARVCYLVFFAGLTVGAGRSPKRLLTAVWIMAVTGFIVAAYALLQFVGRDPFLSAASYTFNSRSGPVLRIIGTLGHSNYLGNFLLYTTPFAASLAVASQGRARRLALAGGLISAAAIVFSGTRGAWVGLLVASIVFAVLEWHRVTGELGFSIRRARIGVGIAAMVVLISVIVIIASPRSSNIVARVRAFGSDSFTGSGRTLLWRDAVRMVPAFSLIGCGPDAFSRAFLAYKSRQLAISASTINNESSHNSYLDAAISFGVIGAVTYIGLFVYAFVMLSKARRRAPDKRTGLIITGLISSLAAVCVHNFFIYDQIPTGMYFFALMALASIASNIGAASPTNSSDSQASSSRSLFYVRWFGMPSVLPSVALVVLALWFSTSLVIGDIAIKRAFSSATSGDFEGLQRNGKQAIDRADPTGAYSFMFARALSLYLDRQALREEGDMNMKVNARTDDAKGSMAIETGKALALKSLAHTLAPEANYVLLAYFALQEGNKEELHEFASQAIRWDPNYFNAHWLMSEALLAEGDKSGAEREAQIAVQLRPGNSEAISVLARARGDNEALSPRIQGLLERARMLREKKNNAKAQELLTKAIQFSPVPCAACHRELALSYEETDQTEKALDEWKEYVREAPDRAAAEGVASRIAGLGGKK